MVLGIVQACKEWHNANGQPMVPSSIATFIFYNMNGYSYYRGFAYSCLKEL